MGFNSAFKGLISGETFDQISDFWLLKKEFALWNKKRRLTTG